MGNRQGFTIIELLVVIAIIGLLSSVVLVIVNGAVGKSRDIRRIADLQEIRKALDLYYNKFEHYPENSDNDMQGGWDIGNVNMPPGDDFIKPLEEQGIINPVPREEHFSQNEGTYRYFLYDPPPSACGRVFYILMAKLERSQESYSLQDSVDSCLEAGLPALWSNVQESSWYAIMGKE